MQPDRKDFVHRLFQYQGGALLRYLTWRVRNANDAQDIAQEAYLRLLRFERVDLIRDPQGYLFRVAANLAREHQLREAKLPVDIRATTDLLILESGYDGLEESADREARLAQLAHVISGLDPRHRAVLLLHRRDGMTYEEIAAELGISFHTVKKYLSAALAVCRAALPAQDSEPRP